MEVVAMWRPRRWHGCEHTVVRADDAGVQVDGVVLHHDDRPFRLRYRLTCDANWATRRVELDCWGLPPVTLVRDADNRWSDDAGPRPDLAGGIDVDISFTPLTNTLPIRRLALGVGESRDLLMTYVDVEAGLQVEQTEQRYTRLPPTDDGARYRYESGTFQADLQVDTHGLVMDYPGLWERAA